MLQCNEEGGRGLNDNGSCDLHLSNSLANGSRRGTLVHQLLIAIGWHGQRTRQEGNMVVRLCQSEFIVSLQGS